MPITEAEMSLEDMKVADIQGRMCGECSSQLTIAWGGMHSIDGFILRCPRNINHNTIKVHTRSGKELAGMKLRRETNMVRKLAR